MQSLTEETMTNPETISLLAIAISLILCGVAYVWVPTHLIRRSGILKLVLLIDNSISNGKALRLAIEGGTRIIDAVQPGDRLAVFSVAEEVKTDFNVEVDTPATRKKIN